MKRLTIFGSTTYITNSRFLRWFLLERGIGFNLLFSDNGNFSSFPLCSNLAWVYVFIYSEAGQLSRLGWVA